MWRPSERKDIIENNRWDMVERQVRQFLTQVRPDTGQIEDDLYEMKQGLNALRFYDRMNISFVELVGRYRKQMQEGTWDRIRQVYPDVDAHAKEHFDPIDRETHLEEMCRAHFNEPILLYDKLARVIGYGEDEMDCYIICKHIHGEVRWHTCVGGYIFLNLLKDQGKVTSTQGELWSDFTRLDNFLTLNGAPPEPAFMLNRVDFK